MNHHQILGVSPTATKEQVRRAYKKLALRYHPDRNPNDPNAEEKFKQINAAYQAVLKGEKVGAGKTYKSYQRQTSNQQNTQHRYKQQRTYQQRQQRAYRRRPTPPPTVDHTKNVKFSVYAFLLVIGLALFSWGGSIFLDTYGAKENYKKATTYWEVGEREEAQTYLSYALEQDERHAAANALQALILLDGQPTKKASLESASFFINRAFEETDFSEKEIPAQWYETRALINQKLGFSETALENWESAWAAAPENFYIPIEQGAILLHELREYEEAIEKYETGLVRIQALLQQEKFSEDKSILEMANQAYLGQSLAHLRLKNYTATKEALERARLILPKAPRNDYMAGFYWLEAEENLDEACQVWQEALTNGMGEAITPLRKYCWNKNNRLTPEGF